LNLGLLAFILLTNVGTHRLTRGRLALPVVLVAVAAVVILRDVPTLGNDDVLELVGVAAGVALGVVAGLLVKVRRDPSGDLVMTAGALYAGLWTAVIGGRVLFAYGADHWFTQRIGLFSFEHQITGADAWTAAFVLMALAMVLTRVVVTAALAVRASRSQPALVAAAS
jgi:hypothetical protein